MPDFSRSRRLSLSPCFFPVRFHLCWEDLQLGLRTVRKGEKECSHYFPFRLSKTIHSLCDNHVKRAYSIVFNPKSIPTAPWCQVPRRCHRGSPTTIQLATLESVLVVHLVKPGGKPSEACAPMIDAILRDENIIKAGCGVDQDIMALHRLWPGLEATSRFDLASLFQTDKGYTPGLATLTERVVGLELPKPRKVQMSNWGQVPLDKRQIVYAGRDAWAGAAIAAVLESNDPELFSPEPLKNALKRQVTIGDLNQKWEQRQRGKKVKRAKQTFICVPIQLPVASASPPAEMSSPPPAGMNSAPVMTPPSLPTLNLDEAFPLRQLSIGKGTVRKQRKD